MVAGDRLTEQSRYPPVTGTIIAIKLAIFNAYYILSLIFKLQCSIYF